MMEGRSKAEELPDGLKFGTHISEQTAGFGEYYWSVKFPDADAENNNAVYWSSPESAESYTFILMREEREEWQYATALPGRILVVAREPGCFHSSLRSKTNLITSVCCGDVACRSVDMGSGQIFTGHFPQPPSSRQKLDCKVKEIKQHQGNRHKTTGPQKAVSNTQSCTTDTCKFLASDSIEFSRSVSTSTAQELTTTIGAEVSIEAGTTAILTFTHIYYCDVVNYDCAVDGNQDNRAYPETVLCNHFVTDAGIPGGEYEVVYLS
ncbi:hypothetical protein K458DRAFT_404629 [Lentithecium fluviatile CBS 122367]|uniref:Uncharacterized protein n=1 Tax=Lentithecium fluviatile CBS 122367 TaxID=1168545 RepID=A0A6G1J0F7_9PLEO|nr:hypothetical protein K458DRAFT_404629 [Lentithecium fluviatile CBS 122367]